MALFPPLCGESYFFFFFFLFFPFSFSSTIHPGCFLRLRCHHPESASTYNSNNNHHLEILKHDTTLTPSHTFPLYIISGSTCFQPFPLPTQKEFIPPLMINPSIPLLLLLLLGLLPSCLVLNQMAEAAKQRRKLFPSRAYASSPLPSSCGKTYTPMSYIMTLPPSLISSLSIVSSLAKSSPFCTDHLGPLMASRSYSTGCLK